MSFSPAKKVVFRLRIVLPNTIIAYHRAVGYVIIVPIVLHVLHIFQIGQRRGVLRVSMFFRKESSCSWMDDLGMVKVYWEPKDVWEAQCSGFFQPRQGLNVNT